MLMFTTKDINVFIFKDYLLENHLIEAITSVDLFVKMILQMILNEMIAMSMIQKFSHRDLSSLLSNLLS